MLSFVVVVVVVVVMVSRWMLLYCWGCWLKPIIPQNLSCTTDTPNQNPALNPPMAPPKMSRRSSRMARTAAMKKVLSPSSVTMIMERLLTNAPQNPPA